ncbi:hypothetical protein MHYP_G00096880 [Metynnis hypsauchen]
MTTTVNATNVTPHQSTNHGPQNSSMATYNDFSAGFPAFVVLCLTLSIILVLFTSVVLLFTRLHKLKFLNSVSLVYYEEEVAEMTASRKRCNKSYREKINSVYFTWTPDNWTSA